MGPSRNANRNRRRAVSNRKWRFQAVLSWIVFPSTMIRAFALLESPPRIGIPNGGWPVIGDRCGRRRRHAVGVCDSVRTIMAASMERYQKHC